MREILFRGEPTEVFKDFLTLRKEHCHDGFVYGSLVVSGERYYICVSAICSSRSIVNNGIATMVEVIPETVGQFTGRYDKNNEDIFEGDIVRAMMDFGPAGFSERIVLIDWIDDVGYQWEYFDTSTIEVIGNMHNNPEMIG